jgi:hypothetical protein
VYRGAIEIPTITEGEDKSKGDDIAKAITLVQTLWFTIQAANRVAQGYSMTELELTFIYWRWWNKPLNVDYPVDLHAKSDEKEVDATPKEGKEEPAQTPEKDAYNDVESQTPVLRPLPLRIRIGAYILVFTGQGLLQRSSTLVRKLFAIICFSIIGGIFGAIHCLAWNSVFPTLTECILWRVAALVVTAMPGIIFAAYIFQPLPRVIHKTLKSPLVIIYCLAWTCLLVQVLATIDLRDLPFKAYMIPSWSKFMPHIG